MALISSLALLGFTPNDAKHLGWDIADGLTALGTSQGTALALTAAVNRVGTVTGTDYGVRLPKISEWANKFCIVKNDSANGLFMYPALGDRISGLAVNAPFGAGPGVAVLFFASSETVWLSLAGT